MIAALCANPCVDRTVTIDAFAYGGMNRIREIREDGGGKGVNVALAVAQLGLKAVCLGFLPVERNALIVERLRQGGCGSDFVPCAGAVRVNTKVLDRATGAVTELNESGPTVSPADVEALVDLAVRWGKSCGYMVLTGSTTPGCPTDFYKTIIEEVGRAAPGCRVVLDAEGPRFAEGLKARPYLVKPNRFELELLCGRPLPTVQDIHAEARKLVASGVALVAVSMGGDGAYITDGSRSFAAAALKVPMRGTVGAGDSMVAGLLLGLEHNLPLDQVFRSGMAAAASSVTTVGTGLIDRALYHEYMPQVEIRQVR